MFFSKGFAAGLLAGAVMGGIAGMILDPMKDKDSEKLRQGATEIADGVSSIVGTVSSMKHG